MCGTASWHPGAQCPMSSFPLSSWPLHFPTLSSHFNEIIKAPVSSSTVSSYPLGFRPPAFPLTSVVRLFPVVSRSCIIRPVNDPPVLPSLPVPACLPLFSSIQVYIHAYTYICNAYIYSYICIYVPFHLFISLFSLYSVYLVYPTHLPPNAPLSILNATAPLMLLRLTSSS